MLSIHKTSIHSNVYATELSRERNNMRLIPEMMAKEKRKHTNRKIFSLILKGLRANSPAKPQSAAPSPVLPQEPHGSPE
jgi:hypothetical protein